jgi:streptomycin 6-kinase
MRTLSIRWIVMLGLLRVVGALVAASARGRSRQAVLDIPRPVRIAEMIGCGNGAEAASPGLAGCGIVHPIPVSRWLREAVEKCSDSPDDRAFVAWVDALPELVATIAARWRLDLGAPFEPGGQVSWVAPVRGASGDALVLKLGWPHAENLHESEALRLWDGAGAVRLHDAAMFDGTCALLLERCVPGTSLRRHDVAEQDVVIAGLLRQLWVSPPPGHPFRPLAELCRDWGDRFERKVEASTVAGRDVGLLRAAVAVYRELPGTAAESVLLCTDLHADNVLAAGRAPWLAIDPKPYLGDPAYDPVQHLLDDDQRLAADAAGVTGHMAGLLDVDVQRLRLWLFARCAEESLDRPEFVDIATELAR